ncbi:MAG: hypothetical protein EOO46_00395 [Flavobacterium sp.]|nr:MAG: hypothetical protein EOO46_00395 [Flavobacterium sp.]
MKRFVKNIAKTILLALLVLTAVDFAYTWIFTSAAPKDKIALLRSHKGEKIDYIFVGSSRVNNSIVPSIIEKRTGKTALNLGVSSARPHDVLTIVKLLKAYDIKCDSIFVQVDYGFNHFDSSVMMEFQVMPFIWQHPEMRDHIDYLPNAFALKYVPFFRYAAYDQKLGIHALYRAFRSGRPSEIQKSDGYMARKGQRMLPEYSLPSTIVGRNKYHDALEKFAENNNLHLVYFTSPFFKTVRTENFMRKLRTKVPALHDYSKSIKIDRLFSNQSHLNHEGAKYFTNLLIDDLLKKRATEP